MGKRNKSVNLTRRKIDYVIRAKIRNHSTQSIAVDMKISPSTVKRVWVYWVKNQERVPIRKTGRKKKKLDEESSKLIIEIHKEQNLGARRLEKIHEFRHGVHIPHNAIHKVLLDNGLASENRHKKKRANL